TGGRHAVVFGGDVGAHGAHLDAGHIAQAHLGAVVVHLEQDVAELLGGFQTGLADDGGGQLLAGHGGQAAQLAGGHLHVLRADGVADVHRGQGIADQLGRIQPDTHRVGGTEHGEVAHARGPRQRVLDVGDHVVGQVDVAVAAIGGNQ